MKATSFGSAVVPSPAVLRFLRIQNDFQRFTCSNRARFLSTATSNQPTRNASRRSCCDSTLQVEPLRSSRRHLTSTRKPCSTSTFTTLSAPLTSSSKPRPALQPLPLNSCVYQKRHIGRDRPWEAWRQRRQKDYTPALQPNDLPIPRSQFLDDNDRPGRVLKPGNELKLRCTEFDENGNVTLVNGEFRKSELIQKYGLLPRDLRKIDSSLLPHILVRPSAILINLLHIRCLIKHNRVLVFDAYGSTDSYMQSAFIYDLTGKLQQREGGLAGGLSYEFRALEAVLISVTAGLEGEFEGVREPVVKVLRELEENIDRDKLRHLLIYSKKLGTFEQKARLVRDAIDELLEADDDLADMYLTEKALGTEREEDDHTEVEMLLESYHKVCDEIVQVGGNLVSNIRNTEEIVKAILDANRNSLMLLDLKFSIGTLGIGAGTFIAALYGMNLKSFIEESDYGFAGVSLACGFFTAIACLYGLRKLRKVQTLSMWGETETVNDIAKIGTPGAGRRSWREVDPQGQLSGESRVDRINRWKDEQKRLKMEEVTGGIGGAAQKGPSLQK